VSQTLSNDLHIRTRTTQQPVQGPRRSARSTGDKKEEWIKIPVELSVSVEGSDPRILDGFVYLSSENLRKCWSVCVFIHGDSYLIMLTLCLPSLQTELYKKGGLVFFETTWEGACYNFQVPEGQLPMLTSKCFRMSKKGLFPTNTKPHAYTRVHSQMDKYIHTPTHAHIHTHTLSLTHTKTAEHPLYVAELAKVEETKNRKLDLISELLKLSRSNVDVYHEMDVMSIEHSHNKDLLACKIQMQANLAATVKQSHECNPPALPSTLDHQRFALQQPPFVSEHKSQDLPVVPGVVSTTRVFPVLERLSATQCRADSCNFDEAFFPTFLPDVTTTSSTTVKAVGRKRSRHEKCKRVTGAGDSFEEESGERNSLEDSADEDNDRGYQDIVDYFQARLLQKGPVARPAACKGPRRNRPKTASY